MKDGIWIPAPRFCGDKFTPAKAGAGMTTSSCRRRLNIKPPVKLGAKYNSINTKAGDFVCPDDNIID